MYCEMKDLIDREPDYSTLFRNIKAVTKNCVTMPFKQKDGVFKNDGKPPPKTMEVDVFKPDGQDIDKGPEGFKFVLEIHLVDRIFTLYTQDISLQ